MISARRQIMSYSLARRFDVLARFDGNRFHQGFELFVGGLEVRADGFQSFRRNPYFLDWLGRRRCLSWRSSGGAGRFVEQPTEQVAVGCAQQEQQPGFPSSQSAHRVPEPLRLRM